MTSSGRSRSSAPSPRPRLSSSGSGSTGSTSPGLRSTHRRRSGRAGGAARRRRSVAEAFTAGFLIGVHLTSARSRSRRLTAAVDLVQERATRDRRPLRPGSVAIEASRARSLAEPTGRRPVAIAPTESSKRGWRSAWSWAQAATATPVRSRPSESNTRSISMATGAKSGAGQTKMSSAAISSSTWCRSDGSSERISVTCA